VSEAIRASFDRIAAQYAADFADELTRKPWDAERLRRFAAACAPGPVLDVGCGAAGHVGRFVADLGVRVVGVDLSARSAALARGLNPDLAFVAADMRALPFATGACAGIVAFYSLIYEADPAPALVELRRVLRPRAPLLAAVHGGEGIQRFDSYKGLAVDVTLHLRSAGTLAAQAVRAGFALEEVEARPPYPFEHATERLYLTVRAAG
jgi:SAM-dependent methyltransferase